eukprot:gene17973-21460_t
MQTNEIIQLAKTFVAEGVKKIRLTGGEPLVRKDAAEIISALGKLPVDLTMTTNEKFIMITRRDAFHQVKSNIELLLKHKILVKINMVVMKGLNDHEILDFIDWTKQSPVQVRFIEFMPFSGNHWTSNKVCSLQEILAIIAQKYSAQPVEAGPHDTAKNYTIPNHKGSFAIISTMTAPFCSSCNRMRLTADGKLKNCLFSKAETDLLTALRAGEDVLPLIKASIQAKEKELGGQLNKNFEQLNTEKIINRTENLIDQNITALDPVKLPVQDCFRHVLAKDVFALCNVPAFPQSAMDGYAIRFEDRTLQLNLTGEMAAGTAVRLKIHKGQTARIFTGAPLPDGADTVVMQEKIAIQNGNIMVLDAHLKPGNYVRAIGSEIKASALAMKEGDLLNAAAIGFLAGIGITEAAVYPIPRVSIIITGKEFCLPGKKLESGQVYESNSYTLRAALIQAGISIIEILYAYDDLKILQETLTNALQKSDAVLLTGGVSVGDYDFVVMAAQKSGVKQIFHMVKQKPGKPLYFGLHGKKPVFGLPGNPSSVLSCFYHYVLPALYRMARKDNPLKKIKAKLSETYHKPPGLTHFLKGSYQNGLSVMQIEFLLFFGLLFIVAFLYSSVGHGGASGYLALMAIFAISPLVMKPTALLLNLFVSSVSFIQFYRGGHFKWKIFWPFALASIPLSFLGGTMALDNVLYKKILGILLIFPVIRFFFFKNADPKNLKGGNLTLSFLIGGVIGLLSGMIGIGGGIILSPILLLLKWTDQKQTAAISAAFIFVNSVAGLGGQLIKGITFN